MTHWRDDHEHDAPPSAATSQERYGLLNGSSTPRSSIWLWLIALLAIVAGYRSLVFVDETEFVYVTQFGEPVRLCVRPGLEIIRPWQSVWRLDRRLRTLEPPPREMLTEDKENLNVEWYACWRLAGSASNGEVTAADVEPHVRRFMRAVGTTTTAELRLEERLQAAVAAEIGRSQLKQLVSLEPAQVVWQQLTERVASAVRPLMLDQFGIELVDIRLRRFGYPESVKPAVFAEIRSERERVAVQYRAEGASRKTKIESLGALQRDQILAQANREATQIRGQGDAQAIEILNVEHGKNPEFYELLKTLETYRAMLDDQTTIVLSAESPLLKLLTEGLKTLDSKPTPATNGATTGQKASQP